jgi:acyl carrier protein
MEENVENRVAAVMARIFKMEPSQINDKIAPGNVAGWDSLKQMTLIAALEDEFDIEIDDEEFQEMINYRIIVAIIKSYLED